MIVHLARLCWEVSVDNNIEEYLRAATEIEQLRLSVNAISAGQAAFRYFIRNNPGGELYDTMIDIQSHIDNQSELIDLLPTDFPVSMLRQHLDNRTVWTVTISRSRTAVPSLQSQSAGRSRSRNHATLAAVIRAFVKDLTGPVSIPPAPEPLQETPDLVA
jgi:hypothetical protein